MKVTIYHGSSAPAETVRSPRKHGWLLRVEVSPVQQRNEEMMMTLDEAFEIIDSNLRIEPALNVRGDEVKIWVHCRDKSGLRTNIRLSASRCEMLSSAFAKLAATLQDEDVG